MNKRQPPTPLQLHLWKVLDEMTARNRRPPTIRELKEETGSSSTSTTIYQLMRGIDAGRVVKITPEFGAQRAYAPAWWAKMVEENLDKYYVMERSKNA